MALLELKNITKTYKERSGIETRAVRGVSLSVEQGAFASIAGPSGSGKTTLLNIIGALDKPTSGSIIFDGRDITKIPVSLLADFRLHSIGFVFQAYNLFNTLTAVENVEYVMLLKGMPARERRKKALEVLQNVGLGELAHKRPDELSGGQQQRVAVARALAPDPKLILADEPTANLDSVTSGQLIDFMHELNRKLKITFLFSTHAKIVMDRADRLIMLKDGKVE
jgi:putative ABC transport system ATP-binding protein